MALTQVQTSGIADNAVTSAKIPNDAIVAADIADDAVVQAAIADEAVDEARLQVSNAGSNGQFLSKQSGNTGGLTWASVTSTPEGTAILSTGESGGSKFLREDGDNSCSWQPVPAGTPTGGNSGANKIFWENEQTVTHDYTITNARNAGTWGPVTINSGVTVTIGDGEYWTIM